jgi:hypothetical protein
MLTSPLSIRGVAPFAIALAAGLSSLGAQVLPLNFSGGNGTDAVDQYTGIAGSGWKTPWTTAAGSAMSGYSGTVTNTTPLAGGGDYLQMSMTLGATSAGNQWMRLSRQIDNAAINLSSAVMISFTLRPDSLVSNANETFTIFGGTAATNNTGAGDTWKITGDGGGWGVYNGNTLVNLGRLGPANLQDTTYKFTIYSDPTTKSYVVTIDNLTNGQTITSSTLGWRTTAGVENSYINFVAQAGSVGTFGYSLDNVIVAVPEPGTVALLALAGGAVALRLIRRRRA